MAATGKKVTPYIKPMLATPVDLPFSNKDWLFELKLDGYRAITEIKGKKIWLYSRNGLDLARRYSLVVEALKKIKMEVVLDGEIVVLNEKGRPDFQKLQSYGDNPQYPIVYYVFDILSMQKKKSKGCSFAGKKEIVEEAPSRRRDHPLL